MNKRTKEFFTRTEIRTNATRNSNTCQLTHKKKQCLKQRRRKNTKNETKLEMCVLEMATATFGGVSI